MKIRVIVPAVTKEFEAMGLEQYSAGAHRDTEISVRILDKGPASIESRYDEAIAVPDVVRKVVEAEGDGVDAAIVDCMADPGVEAAREMVSIPVVGPAEASYHAAAMLGHKFSVVTILESLAPVIDGIITKAGLIRRLASVRAVNIPVLDLDDQARLIGALVEQSVKAVTEDGAHVIVFGCTGFTGLSGKVEEGLGERDIVGVPVIDPAVLAVKVAEVFVALGLSHSKRTYPAPPEKEIIGY